MPAHPRPCLFLEVSEGTLEIKPRFSQITLKSPGSGAMASAVSLPTEAIVAAPTKIPAPIYRYGSHVITVLASTLRLPGHSQRLFGGAVQTLFLQAALLASGLWVLSQSISMQTWQATKSVTYHFTRLSKKIMWTLWNSTHMKRLKQKIEFEFFTLILGTGGNNLCLIIFWPGWGVLGLVVLALSAWLAV
ncbi:hypothetical protein F5Y12DRAFT_789313 [Xylaria sp. FL1777]|nr:hypothetical protein F5Y12DRAFT_789313 [Xylaria sp. FL1777]